MQLLDLPAQGVAALVRSARSAEADTLESASRSYEFHKHVIRHRFCPTCGIHPYADGVDAKGNAIAAVNVRCLEGIDLEKIKVTHFDGRSRA